MMRARLPLLALLIAAAPLAGDAAAAPRVAQPQPRPATANLQLAPGGDPRLAALVGDHAPALLACAVRSPIRVRLRASFDHRGRARSIAVRSNGGVAVERCLTRALRGQPSARRGASGPRRVTFVLDAGPGMITPPPPAPPRPRPPSPPPPPPSPAAGLQACKVDSDCRVHYQTSACIPGDPVAVAAAIDPARVLARYPVRREACGMGGPQYERLRSSFEGRYAAACQANRCVVVDRGPQDRGPWSIAP